MCGAILPYRQDEVVEVLNNDKEQALIARVFMLENGDDGGILVESALRLPIAFIDTTNAVAAMGQMRRVQRHVAISGGTPFRGQEAVVPFAVVQEEQGRMVARRGRLDGPLMYTVTSASTTTLSQPSTEQMSKVVDATGREVATVYPHGTGLTVQVASGADAGMVMCIIVAERKLRNLRN